MKWFAILSVLCVPSVSLAVPAIVNGNFATSDLTGWSTVGPVTVTSQVAYLQEVSLADTRLLQTFTIPASATTLRFDYAFDSTHTGGGSDGPDELTVYLLDPSTSQPILSIPGYQEFLYSLRTGYVDYDPAIVSLTSLGGALPWTRVTLDLQSLTLPREGRLMFSLFNWGDDGYTTRLAVDNVAVIIPTPHPGDANNDGWVNVGDLGILAGNWGGSPKAWITGDFNDDGWVNVGDLGVLAGNWGWHGLPLSSVPEPATATLLLTAAVLLVGRKKG